jgi:Hydrazine synthase alpha subunit middle domain
MSRVHLIAAGAVAILLTGGLEALADAAPPGPPAAQAGPLTSRLAQRCPQIVFAVRQPGRDGHWYANFSYYAEDENRSAYGDGGRLCKLDVATGQVTVLLDDPKGGVRDPQVHYDGGKVLFSYRPGGAKHYHLYEINADGTGLRPLTDGDYDDIEPIYLPDGGVMFVSSRCKRWVNCWLTQVAVLYRMDGDGTNIRPVSSNTEQDNTPWVLPDGRVLYTRWEYVDRSQVHYHHLWTMNPDGTGQMVFYGNQQPGVVMIDAKPLPGTQKVLTIYSPGHGIREHDGAVAIIDPADGPDDNSATHVVNGASEFRDPYPIDDDLFLVVRHTTLVVMNGAGKFETIYALPDADRKGGLQCHEPRPLGPRQRERVLPSVAEPAQATGRLILANAYEGRNMEGVEPGQIKKLLVLESLPKPINYTGGMDPLSYGGTFTLERIVGTVPVEPDGSAYIELPALRSFFFVALDENDMSIKRMQSFLTVQPGEVTGCVGCHEQRTKTYNTPSRLQALRRPPSRIEPIAGVPDVFDFPRDIQPILDDLCVACHGYEKTERGGPHAGRLILSGDHGPMFSHSYYMMTIARLFSDGRNQPRSSYPPRALGSSASAVLKMLDGSHYGVTASPQQKRTLRLWIESAAPYPGTYAALGTGMIGGYAENQQVGTDYDWPQTKAAAAAIERRCAGCHRDERILPHALSDERGVSFWQPDLKDHRLKFSRHIVFNLSRPAKSLILVAPLCEEAGGFGICKATDGQPARVFADANDPDYQKLLAMVIAGRDHLDRIKRFDMPGFRPRDAYLREMKRYGVLPQGLKPGQPIDPYAVDRAYWRSLWYTPAATHEAGAARRLDDGR